jgi:hypothetical protein
MIDVAYYGTGVGTATQSWNCQVAGIPMGGDQIDTEHESKTTSNSKQITNETRPLNIQNTNLLYPREDVYNLSADNESPSRRVDSQGNPTRETRQVRE